MLSEMTVSAGTLRGVMTGVLMVAFIAVWVWAWSRRHRERFEAAARMPLEDDTPEAGAVRREEAP